MDPATLEKRLREAANEPDDVVFHSYSIVEDLEKSHPDLAAVHTILLFMERNPALEFGTPGPLVHFAERFIGAGYEQELFASLSRRPTPHTVLMLHRLINAAADNLGERTKLSLLLEQAGKHPAADDATKRRVALYLSSR